MAEKTIKQTTIEYFREPSLTEAEINAMGNKLFPPKRQVNFWNFINFIPRPLLVIFAFVMVGLPLFLVYTQNIKNFGIEVDAESFTSSIYQQAESNIVYLEIYSDKIDGEIISQSWYDSTSGLNKTQENAQYPIYSFENYYTNQQENLLSSTSDSAKKSVMQTDYNTPELAAFMKALGKEKTSIEQINYLGKNAYKIPVYEVYGGESYIIFMRDEQIAYIITPNFNRKIIYRFISPNTTNQNSIFDLNK